MRYEGLLASTYFLLIFYRPARTEYRRTLTKNEKTTDRELLVLVRLCSLASGSAFRAGSRGAASSAWDLAPMKS